MKLKYSHITGSLFTISAVAWIYMIYNHFPTNGGGPSLALIPALLCLVGVVVIEIANLE